MRKGSPPRTETRANVHTSKPPRGHKRTRDTVKMHDSSARKRRAPMPSSPSGSPAAAPMFKRRKVDDDLDTDVQMDDATKSPDLSAPITSSARKASHRKKLAKEVLRDNRRRGTMPSMHTPRQNRRTTSTPRTTPCPSTDSRYSYQQPQPNTSSTDFRHGAQSSYFNDSSSATFQTNDPSAWATHDRTNTRVSSTVDHSPKTSASEYFSDEVCELDVSTGAYDENSTEVPESNAGASGAPTLQYIFSSENQLLLNIRYGTSRNVGVVVDIPPPY